jgi:hypothetical protein
MENAPLSEDGYYLTPKVIEQDDWSKKFWSCNSNRSSEE